MARGSNQREGRVARSELSDRLKRKADALRQENEDEKKVVEQNEKDYQDALDVAYMRAEEETRDDFKGVKREVDDDEQDRRAKEAEENERLAKAEAEQEDKVLSEVKTARSSGAEKMQKDLFSVPHTTKPQAWTNAFMDKWNRDVPDEIASALNTYFENTINDRAGFKEALNMAYIEGAGVNMEDTGSNIVERPNLEAGVAKGVPDEARHKAGLANMERFKKFFKKMVKSSTEADNLFDKDGRMRD